MSKQNYLEKGIYYAWILAWIANIIVCIVGIIIFINYSDRYYFNPLPIYTVIAFLSLVIIGILYFLIKYPATWSIKISHRKIIVRNLGRILFEVPLTEITYYQIKKRATNSEVLTENMALFKNHEYKVVITTRDRGTIRDT